MAPKNPDFHFSIDHPDEGIVIGLGHYAVRVSAPAEADVQLAIEGGEWKACRHGAGYWWYDWTPEEPGPVTMVARCRLGGGRWKQSPERFCIVARRMPQ